ncbi:MAG: class I SAM-dependent DNA methyltransferase [Rubritalea sp.]
MLAKKSAKKKAVKATKSFEESLWDTANKLRGSVESSEYKHVVLSLIFLKFVSDKFEERRAALIEAGQQDYIDMVEFYTMENVFYLPEIARWSYIQTHAKQDDIALKIDTALKEVENSNASLKGALPDNYFSRLQLDSSKLSALLDAVSNIDTVADKEEDVVGRVYEYFLGKFAASEGKLGGEFYTPKSVVNLIAEMIEPYKGKIYDPCCGSGGMFVQSLKFVQSHHGNTKDIAVYGQEYTSTTYKLAKMNLAVRGITSNLGEVNGDTFFKDQHPDLKADFIMANPPFNLKEWRGENELTNDPRWAGYDTPPTGNANYAWILHMVSKLSEHGTAGFVLANGAMSTNTTGEGAIRQKMIENDLVDCMIALPGQLFFTTQIPVCIWILSKNKSGSNGAPAPLNDSQKDGAGAPSLPATFSDRKGKTLFIDARKIGSMISRTQKELTSDDVQKIATTYHSWRSGSTPGSNGAPAPLNDSQKDAAGATTLPEYQDIPGYCKSVELQEIKKHDYVLTPGRYVGAAPLEDDGIPFETKMKDLSQTLYQQMEQATDLDSVIRKNLEGLGYGR